MGKFFKEFKEFAMRGNVIDMAVGVVIGGAFGKIVTSLVSDLIMPLISVITGRMDIASLAATLVPATEEAEAVMLNYGAFIQNVVDFIIIALSIFCVIRFMGKLKRKKEEEVKEEAPAVPEPSKEEVLLTEIRDLLKERK